jgi:hypothetical protein
MDLQSFIVVKTLDNKLAQSNAQSEDEFYNQMGELPLIFRAPKQFKAWMAHHIKQAQRAPRSPARQKSESHC